MKYVMVVGDGMADMGIPELGGKTPLAHLAPEAFARIGAGELGRLLSCPEGLPPGSDVAFLTLLGNDTLSCYNGRSPLEAAGMGVDVNEGEVAFRLNMAAITGEGYPGGTMLSHNGGSIDGEDAYTLITDLMKDAEFAAIMAECGIRISPTDTFRHVAIMPGDMADFEMTPPHDIVGQPVNDYMPKGSGAITRLMMRSFDVLNDHPVNIRRRSEGRLAANTAWLWGAGSAYVLDNFEAKFGVRGTAVSAVPLVKGIAHLNGLDVPDVKGATGLLDTNYQGKVEAALNALRDGFDFALVHIEAPDEMSHDGSLKNKLEAIRRVSERVVASLLSELPKLGDFRLILLPDHYTLLSTRTHDGTPVPYAIYDSRKTSGSRPFTEAACEAAPLALSGESMLKQLFQIPQL